MSAASTSSELPQIVPRTYTVVEPSVQEAIKAFYARIGLLGSRAILEQKVMQGLQKSFRPLEGKVLGAANITQTFVWDVLKVIHHHRGDIFGHKERDPAWQQKVVADTAASCGLAEDVVKPVVVGIWERFSGKLADRQKVYQVSKKKLREEAEELQETVRRQRQELAEAAHQRALMEREMQITALEARLSMYEHVPARGPSHAPHPAVPPQPQPPQLQPPTKIPTKFVPRFP